MNTFELSSGTREGCWRKGIMTVTEIIILFLFSNHKTVLNVLKTAVNESCVKSLTFWSQTGKWRSIPPRPRLILCATSATGSQENHQSSPNSTFSGSSSSTGPRGFRGPTVKQLTAASRVKTQVSWIWGQFSFSLPLLSHTRHCILEPVWDTLRS